MSRVGSKVVAVLVVVLALVSACSSSNKTTQQGKNGTEPTITIGVLTDLTGPGADTAKSSPQGIAAGVALAAAEGYHIKYVVVDAETNPTQALAGAQNLVERDHVFAVIGASSVFFAAAPFLQSKGIPVIGGDYDGPEWLTTASMFSVFPYEDYTKVATTIGEITKLLGGTNLATIGYSISPSSSDTAKSYAVSARDAGIKAGYVNPDVPFGTTNVGPLVLGMKSAGIDSLFPVTTPNTALAVVSGLRQQGVDLKVPFLAEEEGDLLSGGPTALQQAKGVDLVTLYEPPEMGTSATKEFARYLESAAHQITPPTLNESIAYLSIDALVDGLKKAGPNVTQASFIQAMLGITHYDGRGLLGSPISFAQAGRGSSAPCTFASEWTGTAFRTLLQGHPYCGKLTGQKV